MTLLHFISDAFEYEEKYNDSADKMSPYIDSFIMYDEKRLDNVFGCIIVESISLQNMLVVLENFRSLVEMANILF